MSIVAGSYHIVSVGVPTLAVTFVEDYSTLKVKPNTADISQIWIVTVSGGHYVIKAAPSIQYAAVGTGNVVGTEVKAQSVPEGWAVEPSNVGSFTIRTPNYNNVWGFTGSATTGIDIKINALSPSDSNQKWRFVPT